MCFGAHVGLPGGHTLKYPGGNLLFFKIFLFFFFLSLFSTDLLVGSVNGEVNVK